MKLITLALAATALLACAGLAQAQPIHHHHHAMHHHVVHHRHHHHMHH